MEKKITEYHLASSCMYNMVVHLEIYEKDICQWTCMRKQMLEAFQKDRKLLNYSLWQEIYWEGFPDIVYVC